MVQSNEFRSVFYHILPKIFEAVYTAFFCFREHCKECCHQDDVGVIEKQYAKAVLEVCTCKFGAYPQIQAFIKSDRPSKFSNLQIKYVRGLDPIIKLFDKDGHLKETVAIEKWNTDSVEEFLNTRLVHDEGPDYLRTNMI